MRKFDYLQPNTLEEASKMTLSAEETMLYGGGTDALSLIKKDIYKPQKVINLKKISALNKIEFNDKELRIGALVTISEIAKDPSIKERFNVLHIAAKEIASPQLRNMGTIGGNLCQRPRCWYYRDDFDCIRKGGGECFAYEGRNKYHCVIGGDPCYIVHPSDMGVALTALDAKINIYSEKNGEKIIPINDFFILPSDDLMAENILQPGEIVKEIIIDMKNAGTKSNYVKFKERETWDFAIVSVAASIRTNDNKILDGKIVFGGVAPKPWIDKEFNKLLPGLKLNESSIEEAVKIILKDAVPLKENGYKIPLIRNLTKRLLMELV